MIRKICHMLGLTKPLYITHSFILTKLGEHEFMGERQIIEYVKELSPTSLINGGTARCWAVYGRVVSQSSTQKVNQNE